MKPTRSKTAETKALVPADTNRETIVFDLDPKTVVKTIAAGICLAGIQLIEAHGGRTLPPAKNGADVLTADEVADFLRLDRKTIYDYAGRGVIPSKRIGKRLLFSRAAIELWLSSCSKGSSDGGAE
jgi:excisionase family DNA binding protein